MIKYVIKFILSYLTTLCPRARNAHKVTVSCVYCVTSLWRVKYDVPAESESIPCEQQSEVVTLLTHKTFENTEMPTTVVESSFRRGRRQKIHARRNAHAESKFIPCSQQQCMVYFFICIKCF